MNQRVSAGLVLCACAVSLGCDAGTPRSAADANHGLDARANEVLDAAGAYVGADDYAAVGRRVVRPASLAASPAGDPWGVLLARYWAAPPCSTRSSDHGERIRHLGGLLDRSGARGVILHVLKFCEPELFDVPVLRRTFAERGVPVLYLEGELEAGLSGQVVTRVEAFVEMISAGRAA